MRSPPRKISCKASESFSIGQAGRRSISTHEECQGLVARRATAGFENKWDGGSTCTHHQSLCRSGLVSGTEPLAFGWTLLPVGTFFFFFDIKWYIYLKECKDKLYIWLFFSFEYWMSQYAFVNLIDECLCGGPPSGKLANDIFVCYMYTVGQCWYIAHLFI